MTEDPTHHVPPPAPDAALAVLVREAGRDVLATLARHVGDLSLAEDAVQDAVVRALETWPRDGVPPNPVAWLRLVARRRAIDLIRSDRSRGSREERVVLEDPDLRGDDGWAEEITPTALHDDLLRLIFTCCHPSLAPASRVALALRTLCGLSEAEIATALLSTEDAVARRLVRARQKIRQARIPYRVPADHELPERWDAVLVTVYLLFNEGYTASGGDELHRPGLSTQAVRLARLLHDLEPDDVGAIGLLALVLLQDSRRDARLDADGVPVLLPDQDRSRWDTEAITDAVTLLGDGLRRSGARPHRFVVQAAIAACHALAPRWEETDWDAIVSWYDVLLGVDPSPVAALNRAVAIGGRDGAEAGLAAIEEVAALPGLETYPYLHASRAVLLRRLGRDDEAAAADRRAAELPLNSATRGLLDPA